MVSILVNLKFMKNANNKKESPETRLMNNIARFYGFRPITSPTLIKSDFDLVKKFQPTSNPEEKAALLRIYFEEKKVNSYQLANIFCDRPFPGSKEARQRNKIEKLIVSLGSSKYVSECLSIQLALSILEEFGYKNIEVRINSIGDKDSINSFQKNLTSFIKKNIASFPSDLRQAIKKDNLILLKENREEWKNFQKLCPKTIDFLSESSRLHLKQVLEFLEIIEIPYNFDHSLLGDFDFGSETVFAIRDEDDEIASGFRFNRLGKKLGYKKELACSFLKISAKIKKTPKKTKLFSEPPKFYLVQFGTEARLKSFAILKDLYKAQINVFHLLDKDRLDDQINIAEKSGTPYIILIGQKEALDGVVILRNVATRSQHIIPIGSLGNEIKKFA